MKHTPGPWKPFIKPKIVEVYDNNGLAVVSWMGFDDSRRTHKTHIANAYLIAAAPELLEALENIANAADNGDCYCEVGEGYHAIECPIAIAGIARAAIAKAKG